MARNTVSIFLFLFAANTFAMNYRHLPSKEQNKAATITQHSLDGIRLERSLEACRNYAFVEVESLGRTTAGKVVSLDEERRFLVLDTGSTLARIDFSHRLFHAQPVQSLETIMTLPNWPAGRFPQNISEGLTGKKAQVDLRYFKVPYDRLKRLVGTPQLSSSTFWCDKVSAHKVFFFFDDAGYPVFVIHVDPKDKKDVDGAQSLRRNFNQTVALRNGMGDVNYGGCFGENKKREFIIRIQPEKKEKQANNLGPQNSKQDAPASKKRKRADDNDQDESDGGSDEDKDYDFPRTANSHTAMNLPPHHAVLNAPVPPNFFPPNALAFAPVPSHFIPQNIVRYAPTPQSFVPYSAVSYAPPTQFFSPQTAVRYAPLPVSVSQITATTAPASFHSSSTIVENFGATATTSNREAEAPLENLPLLVVEKENWNESASQAEAEFFADLDFGLATPHFEFFDYGDGSVCSGLLADDEYAHDVPLINLACAEEKDERDDIDSSSTTNSDEPKYFFLPAEICAGQYTLLTFHFAGERVLPKNERVQIEFGDRLISAHIKLVDGAYYFSCSSPALPVGRYRIIVIVGNQRIPACEELIVIERR